MSRSINNQRSQSTMPVRRPRFTGFVTTTATAAVVLIVMFSLLQTSARAFSVSTGVTGTTARSFARSIGGISTSRSSMTRFMSGNAGDGPDTTIVSVCEEKIMAALETDKVVVTGAYDDPNGSHIAVEVVSPLFAGKRPVQRQQMVYKAIWEELQGPVHAVDSVVCKTPEEA